MKRLKVTYDYDFDRQYLDIRAGFAGAEFDDSVETVVRRDNVTVGLRIDGHPVYVRIRGAENYNAVFEAVAKAARAKRALPENLKVKLNSECLTIMKEMAHEFQKQRLEKLDEALSADNVKYTVQCA
jgi:hypothetical protein